MTPNIGTADRFMRIIAGLAMIGAAIFWPEADYSWTGWFGVVPVLSALAGWTPAYALFGISTISRPRGRNR